MEVPDAVVIGQYRGTRSAFANELSGSENRRVRTPEQLARLDRQAARARTLVRQALQARGRGPAVGKRRAAALLAMVAK